MKDKLARIAIAHALALKDVCVVSHYTNLKPHFKDLLIKWLVESQEDYPPLLERVKGALKRITFSRYGNIKQTFLTPADIFVMQRVEGIDDLDAGIKKYVPTLNMEIV